MKKFFLLSLFIIFQANSGEAKDLRGFLQNCAWGTLAGASVGFVSLVFTDKPSESWSNIAKGASLGLYGGIGYGLYQLNIENKTEGQAEFALLPKVINGKLDGVQAVATVLSY